MQGDRYQSKCNKVISRGKVTGTNGWLPLNKFVLSVILQKFDINDNIISIYLSYLLYEIDIFKSYLYF
jgi:hypothetical protein